MLVRLGKVYLHYIIVVAVVHWPKHIFCWNSSRWCSFVFLFTTINWSLMLAI